MEATYLPFDYVVDASTQGTLLCHLNSHPNGPIFVDSLGWDYSFGFDAFVGPSYLVVVGFAVVADSAYSCSCSCSCVVGVAGAAGDFAGCEGAVAYLVAYFVGYGGVVASVAAGCGGVVGDFAGDFVGYGGAVASVGVDFVACAAVDCGRIEEERES